MEQQLTIVAGLISTIVYPSSNIPMLAKAFRTKDLRSYSLAYLVMCNNGNGIHWFYIAGLPFGPIWLLHGFYTVVSAMLPLGCLRYQQFRIVK